MTKSTPAGRGKPAAKKHPFSVDVVANVAVSILLHGTKDFKDTALYDEAADVAVRLLYACKGRLDDDELHLEKDRQIEALKEPYRQDQREKDALGRDFKERVPWLKGLLRITGKRSETDAIKPYRQWLFHYQQQRHAEAKPTIYDPYVPPKATQLTVEAAIEKARKDGFTPAEVVWQKRVFKKWRTTHPRVSGLDSAK